MKARSILLLSAAMLAAGLVVSLPASRSFAQAPGQGFDLQLNRPVPSQRHNFYSVYSTETVPLHYLEFGTLVEAAGNPLIVRDGGERQNWISGRSTTFAFLSYGITNFLQLDADLPVFMSQNANNGVGGGFGIGDPRVSLQARLARNEDGFFRGAMLVVNQFFPVGAQQKFQGERSYRVQPMAVVDLQPAAIAGISVNVGYMVRPSTEVADVEVDDTITFGVAGDIEVVNQLHVIPQLTGGYVTGVDDFGPEELPLEVRVVGEYQFLGGLTVGLEFARRLTRGPGGPAFQGGLHVTAQQELALNNDRDGDGFKNAIDECPDDPEDFDQFEDLDGCPDGDNDGDGILDVDDLCGDDPEDIDQFEDGDGCPEDDNDGDGIPDVVDGTNGRCANLAEDPDGYQDGDGCPDNDNDGDSYFDDVDACPIQAETFNGNMDQDGCPDPDPILCETIPVPGAINFESGDDELTDESLPVLDLMAEIFAANPDIINVEIEGHTDSDGPEEYNLELSQDRVESVVEYLIEQGVEESRITPVGRGESQPIADNDTEEGKMKNRRVVFRVIEREGCPAN